MVKRLLPIGLAVVAVISTIALANTARAATNKPAAARTVTSYITLYGWVDNSPPGNGISGGRIHSHAGGRGTYADPVTFATDVRELPYGTRIYVSYMKKYFIHEDECTECDHDWSNGKKWRTDLWAGGDRNSVREPEKSALLNCEDSLTRHSQIIINPAANLPVTTTPIFNASSRQCYTP
jgi:hypothetical protein